MQVNVRFNKDISRDPIFFRGMNRLAERFTTNPHWLANFHVLEARNLSWIEAWTFAEKIAIAIRVRGTDVLEGVTMSVGNDQRIDTLDDLKKMIERKKGTSSNQN